MAAIGSSGVATSAMAASTAAPATTPPAAAAAPDGTKPSNGNGTNLNPSTTTSAAAAGVQLPTSTRSFFSFVHAELFVSEESGATSDAAAAASSLPSQLVYNFLILPWYLERLLTLGFFICLDCFLHLFTVLPFRMAVACVSLARSLLFPFVSATPNSLMRLQFGIRLNGAQLCDFFRGVLFLTCWYGLAFINMSRMYHYIRGQSVLKLYVIFNMLQISDRLFCSFGEDILEALFASCTALAAQTPMAGTTTIVKGKPVRISSKPIQALHVLFHFSISVIYVFGHSLLLFAQMITLNVSVNSDNSSLFVVLVSNNFIELKGAVFKRFDHHNLMQISASDIVERFQLTIFLVVIVIQNLAHIGLAFAGEWLEKAGFMCFMVMGGEWIVDWIKHGFITKFNGIPPVVYRHFGKVLCTDYIHTHKQRSSSTGQGEPSIHSVSRRLGLPSLPIAVLVVRVVYQAFLHSPSHLLVKSGLLLVGFVCLILLKCLLTISLLGHAAKRVIVEPLERERMEAFQQALQAPAHQHLQKKIPAQATILPKVVNVVSTPVFTSAATPPPNFEKQSSVTYLSPLHPTASYAANMQLSSTQSSPSLFGLKGPTATQPILNTATFSPLTLNESRSIMQRPITRTSTPNTKRSPLSTPRGSAFSPGQPTTAASSPRGLPPLPLPPAAPIDAPTPSQGSGTPLTVTVNDNDGSSVISGESLTQRFGRINSPTALERFGSSMSPEPAITPTDANVTQHTVTVQLDNTHHHTPIVAAADDAGQSGSITSPPYASWPSPVKAAQLDDEVQSIASDDAVSVATTSVTSSSISVVSSATDQVEVVRIPLPAVNGQLDSAPNIATLHIYHHQVAAPMSDAAVAAATAAAVAAQVASPPQIGGESAAHTAPSVLAYPPTVVTINSSSSSTKEKAPPAYEDETKIAQDLQSVERYKIGASGKAIPV